MAVRRNIGGKYYMVRDKDTPKGRKGTIIGRWSNKAAKSRTKKASAGTTAKRTTMKAGTKRTIRKKK